MAEQVFPTKGNLLNIQKSLKLATVGYELLDKKRNILIRELMQMVNKAKELRGTIDDIYVQAYHALQMANIAQGLIENVAEAMPIDDTLKVSYRSVMGCELPQVAIKEYEKPRLLYGFLSTDENVDVAYLSFERVKFMTAALAEVDNGIYRLTNAIRKTQTRANALQNIVIPRYKRIVKFITESLEEKEREDFSRMKVIKSQKAARDKRKSFKLKNVKKGAA
jgi:V/A-type H+-transporting ATPase subunit D